jgi:hypothetical protein
VLAHSCPPSRPDGWVALLLSRARLDRATTTVISNGVGSSMPCIRFAVMTPRKALVFRLTAPLAPFEGLLHRHITPAERGAS